MSDITAFILARLDEDEAVARAATSGPWRYWLAPERQGNGKQFGVIEANWHELPSVGWASDDVASGYTEDPGDLGQEFDASALRSNDAEHIARHDPARVLAEVAAKRAIVELHSAEPGQHPDFCGHDLRELPCPTLKQLAHAAADHEDYDPAWRP